MSKKIHLSERINLTEEENNVLLTNCEEVAEELKNFFANAVKNLNILNYEHCDSLAESIDDPTLKAIVKWRNHPSILAIAKEYKNRANIFFNFVSKEEVLTEIKMLDVSKTIQESDIPVKIIKANENFFAETFCFYFNKALENGKFPSCLKLANITPVFSKKAHVHQKIIIDRLVFSLHFQRYLKGYLVGFQSSLIICYLNFNVVLERVMELNIADA